MSSCPKVSGYWRSCAAKKLHFSPRQCPGFQLRHFRRARLALETSAFEFLCGGQFTTSTQAINHFLSKRYSVNGHELTITNGRSDGGSGILWSEFNFRKRKFRSLKTNFNFHKDKLWCSQKPTSFLRTRTQSPIQKKRKKRASVLHYQNNYLFHWNYLHWTIMTRAHLLCWLKDSEA